MVQNTVELILSNSFQKTPSFYIVDETPVKESFPWSPQCVWQGFPSCCRQLYIPVKFFLIQQDLQICLWEAVLSGRRWQSVHRLKRRCGFCRTGMQRCAQRIKCWRDCKAQLIQVFEASLLVKLASLFYVSVRKQGVWPLKISQGTFTME